MTTKVYRNIGADGVWRSAKAKVFRSISAGGVWGGNPSVGPPTVGARVIRLPSGPVGLDAAQDVGWVLSGALSAGEILNTPPQPHVTTYVALYLHTDSGVTAPRTITVRQKRAGVVIASATAIINPGVSDVVAAVSPAFSGAVADVYQLVLPSPADGQMTDLSASLGSAP